MRFPEASQTRGRSFPSVMQGNPMLLALLVLIGFAAGWGILVFPPIKVLAVALGVLCLMLAAWKIDLAFYGMVFFLVILQEAETTPGTVFAFLEQLNRPKIPSLLEVLIAVIVAAFAIRYFITRDEQYSLYGMRAPIALFFALLFIALGIGIHEGFHRDIIKEDFKRFILPILFFAAAVNLMDSRKKMERLLLMMFWVMLIKTCLAIFFYLKGMGFPYGDSLVVFQESGDQMLIVTSIVTGLSLLAERRDTMKSWLLMLLGFSPMLFALIFSYRRNALWGAIFSLGILVLLSSREKRRKLGNLLAGIALAAVALMAVLPIAGYTSTMDFMKNRVMSVIDRDESSNVAHVNEWVVTVEDTMKSPIFGLGLGSSHALVPDFEVINAHTVHNALLMLWMKMGTFALLLFLWCFYRYFRTGIRETLSRRDPLQTGLFATCGLWLIAMNVGPVWFYYRDSCFIALIMAMVIRLSTIEACAAGQEGNKGQA